MILGDQLWPDVMPVVGAKVAASDGASGRPFDRRAVLDRHRPRALLRSPLADQHAIHADLVGQRRDGPAWQLGKVGS